MPACILDACALIAFLRAEPGGEKVRELLAYGRDRNVTVRKTFAAVAALPIILM